MTAQEQQMIGSLIERVQGTSLTEKDPEAEQFLLQGLGRNPDALYILAQTVLVQGYALEQAQKQLADARAALEQAKQQLEQAKQAQAPKHTTSFLGTLFGSGENERPAPPPVQQQYAPAPPMGQAGGYTPVPQYAPVYGQPAPPPPSSFGGGGFLRGAAQTAAGVAAGALAFEGVESLLHGFGHEGGSGFGGGGGPREEIINNYYGDSGGGEHDRGGRGFSGGDVEDRRFDDAASRDDSDRARSFADAGDADDTDATDDTGDADDTDDASDAGDMDDSGQDDTSGDDSSF